MAEPVRRCRRIIADDGAEFATAHRAAGAIDGLLGTWLRTQTADAAEATLLRGGVPAAALANALDLVGSNHLRERGFWEAHDTGVLPGLPWRASFGRTSGAAPGLGADTDTVLAEVLELSADEIAALRQSGALG